MKRIAQTIGLAVLAVLSALILAVAPADAMTSGTASPPVPRSACQGSAITVREGSPAKCDLTSGQTLNLYMLRQGDWRGRCQGYGGSADTYRVSGRLVRVCYDVDY